MKTKQGQYPAKLWFRATVLILAFLTLVCLFSTNSVKLKDEHVPKPPPLAAGDELRKLKDLYYVPKSPPITLGDDFKKLIEKEHATAVEEIKTSMEQMDTWYHYKFILIGGVIALFLGQISILGKQDSDSTRASERVLESVLMSNRTGAMLTLVCIVAFVIDMHIRSNISGIQHLGQWISYYVEPTYLGSAGDAASLTGFIPWETFVRLPRDASSTMYTISFSIQLHFTTMVSYILFLMVFQNISLRSKSEKQEQIAVLGFLLVHITLLGFIIVAHTVRDTFNIGCFPLISRQVCSLSGSQGSTYYVIAWLFLIALSLPYLYPPISNLRSGARSAEPETVGPEAAAPDTAVPETAAVMK